MQGLKVGEVSGPIQLQLYFMDADDNKTNKTDTVDVSNWGSPKVIKPNK